MIINLHLSKPTKNLFSIWCQLESVCKVDKFMFGKVTSNVYGNYNDYHFSVLNSLSILQFSSILNHDVIDLLLSFCHHFSCETSGK